MCFQLDVAVGTEVTSTLTREFKFMVQRKDYFSSDDRFDRVERLERIVALLSSALLGEWREQYSFYDDEFRPRARGDRSFRFDYERLTYGPLNSFLDRLLYDLAEGGRRGPLEEIPDLMRLTKEVQYTQSAQNRSANSADKLSKELHNFVYLMHAGIDPTSIRNEKFLPVRIYTSEDGYKVVGPIERALRSLLKHHGIEIDDEYPPIQGSWFKKMIGRTKDAATSDEVREALKKLKHGVEIETLQKGQAEVNKTNAEAVRELMSAMAGTENAACSIGSILIVKVTKDGKSSVFTKTLTQNEMIAIEDNQAILMDPATVLEKLANLCETDRSRSLPYPLEGDVIT